MNNDTNLTIAALSTLSGAILSLLFTYAPKLKDWYALKTKKEKKLWMLATILVSSIIVWSISCYNLAPGFVNLTCDNTGFASLVLAIFMMIGSNQTFYTIWPQPGDTEDDEQLSADEPSGFGKSE